MKTTDLQKAYDDAVAEDRESFTIDGHEFLTAYAKYLLEYLNNIGQESVVFYKKQ